MSLLKEFSKGLVKENPVFILLLGMCPTLAVTNNAINGLGMGIAGSRRLADRFNLTSIPGATQVIMEHHLP